MDFEQTRLLARLTAIESERVRLNIEIEELEPVEAQSRQGLERLESLAEQDVDGDYSDDYAISRRRLAGVRAELASRRERLGALDRQVELARQEFGVEQSPERPALDGI